MKEDKYTKSLAKNQVHAIVHIRDIRKNVLPKFIKLCMERTCLCPFQGHKCGRLKPTETSVFVFSYLCVNSLLEEFIKVKVIFILRQGVFRQQNLWKSIIFLTHIIKSFPGRQLNAASRKCLEIQASCIAKQRTLLNRKFVCVKVLRCSSITWK